MGAQLLLSGSEYQDLRRKISQQGAMGLRHVDISKLGGPPPEVDAEDVDPGENAQQVPQDERESRVRSDETVDVQEIQP